MNEPGRPGSVVAQLLETAETLKDRIEGALAGAGLSMAKLGVLRILADGGEPMPLSEVAARFQCVRSNITQLVDRLEKDGLVRRTEDASDRRVRLAELTPAGREAQTAGLHILLTQERQAISTLEESDQAELAAAMERLRG